MDLDHFIVAVFCQIDDAMNAGLGQHKLRKRGPAPTLADSEVLTLEVVGAYLGIATDQGIYRYFKGHYAHFFPALASIHHTTFVRQGANLWKLKERLWHCLAQQAAQDPHLSVLDSFPLPVCRLARSHRCRRLREVSAFGYDDVAKQGFLGLRVHLRIAWPGVIVDACLTPADVSDLAMTPRLLTQVQGFVLADRNYYSPPLSRQLLAGGLHFLTPYRWASRDKTPWPRWLVNKRRRIETVIGQVTGRFAARCVWARDGWHLCSRFLRMVLSHTIAVLLCQEQRLPPLSFAQLVTQ